MTDISRRKIEHIDTVLTGGAAISSGETGLERVRFDHVALPELDLSEIDVASRFLGHDINAPLLVSSMTGGPDRSQQLNERIAGACQLLGLPFGVGSQRIALEGHGEAGFSAKLRERAPDVPIFANFGAAQLNEWDGPAMALTALEMIDADALIIHLNPLQEAVQAGGDKNWRGLLDCIANVCATLPKPVIVKEVGAGISASLALQLIEAGAAAIDVSGVGGTSWAGVEAERAETEHQRAVAAAFRDWGIPTATAIRDVRAAAPEIPLIASGGIQTGVDVAKSLRLGADMTGLAAGVLAAAVTSEKALVERLEVIIEQLRITCFCTGSRDLSALRQARLIAQ